MAELDLNKIVKVDFPADQYYAEEHPKVQIVLHHTVSGGNAARVVEQWKADKQRIGTAFCIGGDGTIVQAYSSKYYAYHLGIKGAASKKLETGSIGIEICNWGILTKKEDGKYHNAYYNAQKPAASIVPDAEVITYPKPFRGSLYYHRYTPAQIESVRQLLVFLCDKFKISKAYNEDMWDYSEKAMNSQNGIWAHVSFRTDKSDCHPQPELVEMLKKLNG